MDAETTLAYSAAPGWIVSAEDDWETDPMLYVPGNRVIVFHPSGFTTVYNHLGRLNSEIEAIKIDQGRELWFAHRTAELQFVARGQVLGDVALTGRNPDSLVHLHFEVNRQPWQTQGMYYDGQVGGWGSGEVVDPFRWIGAGAPPSEYAGSVSLWTVDNDPQFPN